MYHGTPSVPFAAALPNGSVLDTSSQMGFVGSALPVAARCTRINIWKYGPRLAELTFKYGTISNLRAKGVDIGDIYETPKPAWWRQAYEYVGSFFRRAPAPKRKREDDAGGPAPKKKVASDAQVATLLHRTYHPQKSAPVEDDDDVVDLTV